MRTELPEKWYIRLGLTRDKGFDGNLSDALKHPIVVWGKSQGYNIDGTATYYCLASKAQFNYWNDRPGGFEEITHDEFKELVMKERTIYPIYL